jgi:hypothetical protein
MGIVGVNDYISTVIALAVIVVETQQIVQIGLEDLDGLADRKNPRIGFF